MTSSALPPHFTPYEPRMAATLLLLRDDPFRVLTVTRNAQSFFPSATVFPGGMVEDNDYTDDWQGYLYGHESLAPHDRALRIAACRETWEETTICAPHVKSARPPDTPFGGPPTDPFRMHLHSKRKRLDLSAITPFARWMTPPEMERRYDTYMFIARSPESGTAICDGHEIISCEWIEPKTALDRAHAGDPAILFSTYFNMSLLAQANDAETAIAMALERPLVPVVPRKVDDADGSWVKIDAHAGYPITQAAIQPYHTISTEKQHN